MSWHFTSRRSSQCSFLTAYIKTVVFHLPQNWHKLTCQQYIKLHYKIHFRITSAAFVKIKIIFLELNFTICFFAYPVITSAHWIFTWNPESVMKPWLKLMIQRHVLLVSSLYSWTDRKKKDVYVFFILLSEPQHGVVLPTCLHITGDACAQCNVLSEQIVLYLYHSSPLS